MLATYRIEHTPQGDLRIHARNLLLNVLLVLIVLGAFGVPLGFLVDAIAGGASTRGGTDATSGLMVALILLLFPALGLAALAYISARDTLTLSRRNGTIERRCWNLLGLRERVETFALHAPSGLELRSREHAKPGEARLWLLSRDGEPLLLSSDHLIIQPGRPAAEACMRTLATFLEVPLTRVCSDAAVRPPSPPPVPTTSRSTPTSPAKRRRRGATSTVARGPSPPDRHANDDDRTALGAPLRALLALLGMFLATLGLQRLLAVLGAFATGRIRVRGARATDYAWSEQHLAFAFNVAFACAEMLVLGVIAWGCVRLAVVGRLKPTR